jgi:hypothetical protein
MTWSLTCTGREHYLCGPSATHPDNVPSLSEIAHSLAHINRYNGHASRPYSVAEHSLLCADIARDQFDADACGQLAALMHDAHESITGDATSPTKQALGAAWAEFEAMHEHHLRMHYGLLGLYQQHRDMVKQCDLIALATERRDLTPFDRRIHKPWMVIDTPGRQVKPWGPVNLLNPGRCAMQPERWAWVFETTAAALLETTQHYRAALENALTTTGATAA